jgi:hypothetical protein
MEDATMRAGLCTLTMVAALLAAACGGATAQPAAVSYQGQLMRDGVPFQGTAQFKFAIVWISEGTTTLWSNDGTSQGGGAPQSSVPLTVDQGVFSVLLGGTGMVPLTSDLLQGVDDADLRVWVDTGTGFEQLSDQPIASSAFSLHSATAERALFGFTAGGIVHSTQGGFQFPDGSVQTTASAGGGGVTLDQAYDFGGPGAGRTITADAGAVNVAGSGGLTVSGKVGMGTTTPVGRLQIVHSGVGTTDPALNVKNTNTGASLALIAESAGSDATVLFNNTGTGDIVRGFNGGGSPVFQVQHSGKAVAAGLEVTAGNLRVDGSGRIRMDAAFGNGSGGTPVYARNTSTSGIALWGETTGSDATAVIVQAGTGDILRLFNGGGSPVTYVQKTGRIVTPSIEITGGADLAEPFDIEGGDAVEPGTVLVIDADHPGRLQPSNGAYDTRVAGIVSGAGGVSPGITLRQHGQLDGGRSVALSGRVYALADASVGPIRPGDLLTTSDRPGYLMHATDARRAPGAVIGKAMSGLESGRGLVLVLVSLQ